MLESLTIPHPGPSPGKIDQSPPLGISFWPRRLRPRPAHLSTFVIFVTQVWTAAQEAPRITGFTAREDHYEIRYLSDPNYYYILERGFDLTGIEEPRAIQLGTNQTEGIFIAPFNNEVPPIPRGFFRIHRISKSTPLDSDQDGIDDVTELLNAPHFDPLDESDGRRDSDGDGLADWQEFRFGRDYSTPESPVVPDSLSKISTETILSERALDTLGRELYLLKTPSVNDDGFIVFAANVEVVTDPGQGTTEFRQNIFAMDGSGGTPYPLMSTSRELPLTEQAFHNPRINNSGEVLVERRFTELDPSDSNPLTRFKVNSYIEVWDSQTTLSLVPIRTVISARRPDASPSAYRQVYAGAINNETPSKAAFFGEVQLQQSYLASGAGQWPEVFQRGQETSGAFVAPWLSLSDTGSIAYRSPISPGEVVIANTDFSPPTRISTASVGVTTVSSTVGLSDDGQCLAFYGEQGSSSRRGVFIGIRNSSTNQWSLHQVAGTSGNGQLDPGETPSSDPNASGNLDSGPIHLINMASNISVSNLSGDRGFVVFRALTLPPSGGFATTLFGARFHLLADGTPSIEAPVSITGAETLSVHDSGINNTTGEIIYQLGNPLAIARARIDPVHLLTDLDNNGRIDSADSDARAKAEEPGATPAELAGGIEYLFANDTLSNGEWDREDTDQDRPVANTRDDDAQELLINPGIESGDVWLEHPAIDALSFFRTPECLAEDEIDLSPSQKFTQTPTNRLPPKVYMRADGQLNEPVSDPQITGDLKLMVNSGGQQTELERIKLTIVIRLGASDYFRAARDYMYENNWQMHVKDWTSGPHTYRVISLLEKNTTMTPFDAFPSRVLGIGQVAQYLYSADVIINGNQTLEEHRERFWAITKRCHGRMVVAGTIRTPPSDDETEDPGSPLAGPLGAYVGQAHLGEGGFVFMGGVVPDGVYRSALGGLSSNYAERASVRAQFVGRFEDADTDDIVFTASQIQGAGGGPELKTAAVASGVRGTLDNEDPSLGGRGAELLALDGSTSVAVAYRKQSTGLKVGPNRGEKHWGIPYDPYILGAYYPNTYLTFKSVKPR